MINFEALKKALGDLDEDAVNKVLDEFSAGGGKDADKALAACQGGMDIVGTKYESGEYFVADLIYAGELMTDATGKLKPFLTGKGSASIGKLVLATVKGDIHDIGKNIVKALMEAGGIEVIDLGIDTAPEAIVEAVKKNNAKVLGLSGVLTLAIESMTATVDALKAAGLRDKVQVIIGGAPVTAEYCKVVGADAWSTSAAESVGICQKWLSFGGAEAHAA
jgi:methylmalonyl-CoA mutase cobalamin-binding domain/chain